MARRTPMQRLARWHIWLGWIVGLPILMWTVTGLFMVARPIEEVRGSHLRIEQPEQPVAVPLVPGQPPVVLREGRLLNQRGRSILLATYPDGSMARFDLARPDAGPLPPVDQDEAQRIAAYSINGGDQTASVRLFDAAHSPRDFGKPMPAWQVALGDGTNVYVGQYTGEIEAVRTRWWRAFDFMWGLHILDPQEREDTSHPLLIALAALSLVGALLGCVLLFRRRRARTVK